MHQTQVKLDPFSSDAWLEPTLRFFFSGDMLLNIESIYILDLPFQFWYLKMLPKQNTYKQIYCILLLYMYKSILPPLFKWQLSQTHPGETNQPSPQHLPERPYGTAPKGGLDDDGCTTSKGSFVHLWRSLPTEAPSVWRFFLGGPGCSFCWLKPPINDLKQMGNWSYIS